jgi:propionyl-CoA synthetase
MNWAARHLGVPVIDHWWQTETGWAICANPLGSGCCRQDRLARRADAGLDVQMLGDDGHPNWRPANWAPSR